jgi:methylthioribulose-1-phosphate dehydratase
MSPDDAADALAETGRLLHGRGWVLGTSGNLSVALATEPLRLAITRSGVDKGRLGRDQVLTVDQAGRVLAGEGKPSDETALHLVIVRERGAGSVLHTHSVWNTLLSERHRAEGGVALAGFEMLKGLAGVSTHEHREWVPILENSQDYAALGAGLERVLRANPDCHGVLLRGHGLYTWGRTLPEATRHLEVLEFLFEVAGRLEGGDHGRRPGA